MTRGEKSAGPLIGFLTVVEDDDLGLVGGYLLLDTAARPVEFHCTAPLRPTRAQRILYGPTLASYLYGELLAPALVAKSTHAPLAVLTDVEMVLASRAHVEPPLALVTRGNDPLPLVWLTFEVGGNTLAVPAKNAADRDRIVERLAAIDDLFELAEPFERIRQAIDEAQREAKSLAA
jgi:hypothetical protein